MGATSSGARHTHKHPKTPTTKCNVPPDGEMEQYIHSLLQRRNITQKLLSSGRAMKIYRRNIQSARIVVSNWCIYSYRTYRFDIQATYAYLNFTVRKKHPKCGNIWGNGVACNICAHTHLLCAIKMLTPANTQKKTTYKLSTNTLRVFRTPNVDGFLYFWATAPTRFSRAWFKCG